ncbi:hypothetical protein [Bacillus sp. AFS015802]|uniref:hypothetical protein n=1 Tax=Bacillus sp. AFS015802 TaxID=2033486 RepID=UPI0015CF14A6|nr:hypothetical protein [Bacillus sp. AFS015802]
MHEKIKGFTEESIGILSSKRESLNLLTDEICSSLESILNSTPSLYNFTISGRVKGNESLREKIVRKNYYNRYPNDSRLFIEELPDIIGIRVTCFLNKEEKEIYNNLVLKFSKQVEDKEYLVTNEQKLEEYPYISFIKNKQPEEQKNGNDIYRIPLKYVCDSNESINVELQIKSLTHMFWGELEHLLFYKNYAYTINSNFYSTMMASINDLLSNIDTQLTGMKEQLSPKDQISQVKEMREILAKLMYEKIHPKVTEILETEIDLREVYTIISQLLFFKCKTFEETLKKTNEAFHKISSIELNSDSFEFSGAQLNTVDLQSKEIYQKLIKQIDELSKQEDLFWHCFVGIYKTLIEKEYVESIEEIGVILISHYSNELSSELEIPIRELMQDTILEALIDVFIEYSKLDYFIEEVHQKNISQIIIESIKYHQFALQDVISEIEEQPQHKSVTKQIISLLIKIQVRFYLFPQKEILISEIEELKGALDDDNSWNAWVNYEELGEILERKKKINNQEELYKLLHYTGEDKEEEVIE